MRQEEGGYGAGPMIFSFFLGGLIGASVALLFAPKSGKETREKIKEFAGEAKGKAEEVIEQVKGRVTSVVEKGKEAFEERKSILATAIDAGKEAYEKEKEKLAKGHPSGS
ncbi:MAG: YtxH domain-containing protein [Deltaproteobacteria bacterium]|nr:YtxH domain-containing protein [Deltaproteobacteria bacterium]